MPKDFDRSLRVAEQLRREVSMLIRDLKDPRVGMVSITEVEVNKDLSIARIYFDTLAENDDAKQVAEALTHAAGFLRREVAKRVKLRFVPRLDFIYDRSQADAAHMDQLIQQALKKSPPQDDQE